MGEAVGASGLASFDPASAELYASVSSDNRLRIWTVATGQLRQQYVEPRHLAKQYTCLAWHRPASKSKRSSSGASKPLSLGLIALGTDKGTISVWDLKRGALAHSLGEGEGLPSVTSVAFSLDGGSLYSASSGKEVFEWNLETGAVARKFKGLKHGATKICLHPAGKMLAIASSSIRLLDVASGKRARKLSAGHAGAVRQLSFSPDGRYLASAAAAARFANIFDVAAGEDTPSEPVATLGFSATPKCLALHAGVGGGEGGAGDSLTVVAGFDSGGVTVLRTRRRLDGKDSTVSKVDIHGPTSSSSPSALHACLSAERPSAAVLLSTGSPATPGFSEALFEGDDGALLSTVRIGNTSRSSASAEGDGEEDDQNVPGAKSAPAHVVGPGELGIRGLEQDHAALEMDDGDDVEGGGGKLDGDGRALKRLKAEEKEGGSAAAALSIAERLEALSEEIGMAGRNHADSPWMDKDSSAVVEAAGPEGQPLVQSLSTVLTQALQSGDEALLEKCLGVGDEEVMEATVEKLPTSKVLPFLLRLVGKLEKRPNRAASLGRWVRALLSSHLGYLVSVPGLPDQLALLHQLIDRRVQSFPRLLQLQGRLDLLLARAEQSGVVAGGRRTGRVVGDRAMDRPAAVYREEDDEEEEEDDDDEEEEEDDDDGSDDGEKDDDQDEEESEDESGDESEDEGNQDTGAKINGGQESTDDDDDDDDDDDEDE